MTKNDHLLPAGARLVRAYGSRSKAFCVSLGAEDQATLRAYSDAVYDATGARPTRSASLSFALRLLREHLARERSSPRV